MCDHIKTILAFLRENGAADIRIEHGGKHPHIRWVSDGRPHLYVTSATLSDRRRATKKALSNLRHMLGLIRPVKRIGERRSKRHRRHGAVAAS
jgi:hypothetical protein